MTVQASLSCSHLWAIQPVRPTAPGCEDCLRIGGWWVHLRTCLSCGHVGCCDQSPHRHATMHFRAIGHPIIRSLEPGENWMWGYVDETFVQERRLASLRSMATRGTTG